jgi:hypothetical protein
VTVASSSRAANGDLVHVEFEHVAGRAEAARQQWCGHVRFTPRYGRRGTTADLWGLDLAPLASLDAGVASVRGRERSRFSLAGGEVLVVDCAEPAGARWAAWLGPWHLVHGMFYAPEWDTRDVVETFTRVRWVDTPEGLTAEPGDRFDFAAVMCLLRVTGIGTMRVEPKRYAGRLVPRWRGVPVPTGEVWQIPDRTGRGRTSLLYVTDTAVTTVLPAGEPGAATARRAVDFLRGVRRLDWVA